VPIVVVFQSPNLTQERYEESIRMLTGKDSISSADDFPFKGQLAHVVFQSAAGFRIVDVWESEEALAAAGEQLMPVLAQLGMTEEAEVYPAHTFAAK
jgi:hypothetical protein